MLRGVTCLYVPLTKYLRLPVVFSSSQANVVQIFMQVGFRLALKRARPRLRHRALTARTHVTTPHHTDSDRVWCVMSCAEHYSINARSAAAEQMLALAFCLSATL